MVTPGEISFFNANGYLQVASFLAPDHIDQLLSALEKLVAQRRWFVEQSELDANKEGIDPSREELSGREQNKIDGENVRVKYLLEQDPLFLDLLDYPPILPYIHEFLSKQPHFHASDAFWEVEPRERQPGWHRDGYDGGYGRFLPHIPLLQLKIGYFLSDMTAPDQGNLMIVPGSHKTAAPPAAGQLEGFDTMPDAIQVCCPPGSCLMFHNALWHTGGPMLKADGKRIMLYYAYEHRWMLGNPEHWAYSDRFYQSLSPERRLMFHQFVFR
jgi:ectoine hydroxylase-related dioxygenase (phytanoyl-CoA dioxygenase family)